MDKDRNKALLWLGILIELLILLLGILLEWLNVYDIDKLLKIIPYKLQLIVWMMIVVALLFAWIYTLTFPKSTKENVEHLSSIQIQNTKKMVHPSQIHYQLQNLTKGEKECLKKFLDRDSRTLLLPMNDPTADGLRSLGILQIVSSVVTHRHLSYKVSDIYWDYMRKKPEVIDIQEKT